MNLADAVVVLTPLASGVVGFAVASWRVGRAQESQRRDIEDAKRVAAEAKGMAEAVAGKAIVLERDAAADRAGIGAKLEAISESLCEMKEDVRALATRG